MRFEPFSYQAEMIRHLDTHNEAALFCSPGLGKTAVALHSAATRILDGECRAALIVAPLRVCAITWPNEVRKWDHSKWMKVANLRTTSGVRAWERGSADIYLINSEMLPSSEPMKRCPECNGNRHDKINCDTCEGTGRARGKTPGFVEKHLKPFPELPADLLIIDELSLAKNPAGKRFKALRAFQDRFKVRWGLTGTPVPNDYGDLFNQIRMLDGGKRLGTVFSAFQRRFFTPDYMGYKWNLDAGSKEKIDAKISDLALVMLGDDYLDVPTPVITDVEVALPAEARKAYVTLEKELLLELEQSEVVALSAATLATKLIQLAGGIVYDENGDPQVIHTAKLEALRKLREKHKDEPMIVFTAYKHEMARILSCFPEAEKFDEKRIPAWQRKEIPMWICQPQSMAHGIDGLQKGGKLAVWHTLPWSNEMVIQSNARLIRTGQSHAVKVYRLLAKDTMDEAVAEALRTKSDNQSGLLNALKALQALRKKEK